MEWSGGDPLSSDSVTTTGCIADGSTIAPLSSDSVTTIEEARSHTQNMIAHNMLKKARSQNMI